MPPRDESEGDMMSQSENRIASEKRAERRMRRDEGKPLRRLPDTLSPALLRRTEAAAYCGRSTATWDRLVSAGNTPAPIKMGGAVLFRRSDLNKWIDLGCPDRQDFEASIEARRGGK